MMRDSEERRCVYTMLVEAPLYWVIKVIVDFVVIRVLEGVQGRTDTMSCRR